MKKDEASDHKMQGVVLLKNIALLGDYGFDAAFTEICIELGAEDDNVCKRTLDAEGPILAAQFRKMIPGSRTAKTTCTNLLGLCPYMEVPKSTLKIPKPNVHRKRPGPSGKKPIQVVHISDTHVDESYTTGSNYNCTKPICCRIYTPSDAPGNTSAPCGPYGGSHCDPPLRLEQSLIAAINTLVNPAFTIFSVDVPAHDIWLVNRAEVERNFQSTYNSFADLRKSLYPSVGNHDTAPVNAFPFRNESTPNGPTTPSPPSGTSGSPTAPPRKPKPTALTPTSVLIPIIASSPVTASSTTP